VIPCNSAAAASELTPWAPRRLNAAIALRFPAAMMVVLERAPRVE
jgi:hypothetical protein